MLTVCENFPGRKQPPGSAAGKSGSFFGLWILYGKIRCCLVSPQGRGTSPSPTMDNSRFVEMKRKVRRRSFSFSADFILSESFLFCLCGIVPGGCFSA